VSSYRGRFAPSPTGPLHFGSLVAAVASWLDARANDGEWLVRIEDVDETRTVAGAAEEILHQLHAFGLAHDGDVAWQSRRKALYDEALERLRSRGLVYRCRCSRKEIADSAIPGTEGAIYPGTCRHLALDRSVPGADRLLSGDDAIGDFVLKRRDGLHAYQLAVVVDDADQRITDVVRGADLLDSTPRQMLLQRLLGYPTPRYVHIPIATNADGEKLSKQTRARAVDPAHAGAQLAAALDFLGQPKPTVTAPSRMLEQAVESWDPARVPRKPAIQVNN
jgi:glutamyl-Q tRNA(Asp) synthetase